MNKLSTVSYNALSSACKELIEKINSGGVRTQKHLELEKVTMARKYALGRIIKNADIASYAEQNICGNELLRRFLKTKPMRTLSGVANIAVMWLGVNKFSCPYKCIYCPQGEQTDANGVKVFAPKSYIGVEPTTLRAIRNNYDPYLQVTNRLKQFHIIGHETDKCELIIMGGTFLAWSRENCTQFVKRCFDAFNGIDSISLDEAHGINETASNRCVGLTIETRADYCSKEQIEYMLSLGATRVEIGVQSTDSNLLRLTKRGHDVNANIQAFERLKNSGLKITAHWMPGLTGLYGKIDIDKEIEMFKELFDNPSYRPDELKIYPTLVIPGTELYELWKAGKYSALSFHDALELLIELKKIVPRYVRIKRVMRDISEHEAKAGARTTNLRQLLHEKMKEKGIKCGCIRCREVGQNKIKPEQIELQRFDYEASGGKEIFLSFEDKNALIAFLRLRIDDSGTAKIRELHVYGELAPLGASGLWQHRGFGHRLMQEAERIAKEFGKDKMQVTSGVGVRQYYRKLGYELGGFYMAKEL